MSAALTGDRNRRPQLHRLGCVQQRNGFDCGVHVLFNAAWLAGHLLRDGVDLDGLRAGDERNVMMGDLAVISALRTDMLVLIEKLSSSDANDANK